MKTEGPDGALHDYRVDYTFGLFPLQQFLVSFPGGRLQALDIAWDSRSAAKGGQRWHPLHSQEPIRAGDVLHWTGPNLTWNYMCASCHSTHLQKSYDEKTESYRTTWAEMAVGCEACHGPGRAHLDWARSVASHEKPNGKTGGARTRPLAKGAATSMGLSASLRERRGSVWVADPSTGKPYRTPKRTTSQEIEVCAPCHSRRTALTDGWRPGEPFFDAFVPASLEEGLYYPDGQMRDEVYVYGSFLQSRMAQTGVSCSDCHEPHSGKLRAAGAAVCGQCHDRQRYATRKHHHHEKGLDGDGCIDCHMPSRLYMGVDRRRDHAFRIPRPDLARTLGTPDACTGCHRSRTPAWAAELLEQWYGPPPHGYQRFAGALAAARAGKPEAKKRLLALVEDDRQPAIARASALQALASRLDRESLPAVARMLDAANPMLRLAALRALAPLPPRLGWPLASPLLEDSRRAVRIEAARLLARTGTAGQSEPERAKLRSALDEYVAAQSAAAERPEAQTNLAGLYADLGQFERAEAAFRRALALQPLFVPASAGLAQLLSSEQREDEAESLLRHTLSLFVTRTGPEPPESAVLHHALGLSLTRQKKLREALPELALAARLAPSNARFGYVYGVALQASGRLGEALSVLESVLARHPDDSDILSALVAYNRDADRAEEARRWASRLERAERAERAPTRPDSLKGDTRRAQPAR